MNRDIKGYGTMNAYRKILVAIDTYGADEYKTVIQRAQEVAGPETELNLIYVHEPFYYGDMLYAGSVEIEQQTNARAKQILAEIGQPLDIPEHRQFIETGRPASEIHARAEEINADLIVLGTHGRHGIQLMLGSTANAVLHGVKCDVLAVRVSAKD
ncbi:MAG: universal stress protein [Pseudomonadales bacterium]